MCAENCSNYSAPADTFPSLETHKVSVTISPQVSRFTVMNGNWILEWKCRFLGAAVAAGKVLDWCLKCTVLDRKPEAAFNNTPSSALRLMEENLSLAGRSSRNTRGQSWGHLQSSSSWYSCPRHSDFFQVNWPCCLRNPTSNKCYTLFSFLPISFCCCFGCHCLSVTTFHLDCCMHYLLRFTILIWGW